MGALTQINSPWDCTATGPEVVIQALGAIRYPCDRAGQRALGAPEGIRTPDPQIRRSRILFYELTILRMIFARQSF
jgi:hypothetical protein